MDFMRTYGIKLELKSIIVNNPTATSVTITMLRLHFSHDENLSINQNKNHHNIQSFNFFQFSNFFSFPKRDGRCVQNLKTDSP